MKVHFLAPYPLFGRVKNRLPVSYQQRSPYYWWWAYLRRNADYLACCEAGGTGALAGLYESFGDVREDNFHKWWTTDTRGAKLFGEPPLNAHLEELDTPADWKPDWEKDEIMVIAVPLRVSKRSLKKAFAVELEKRHPGNKRGRPSHRKQPQRAKFKLERNYTIPNLQNTLAVYDLWLENSQKPSKERLALWEIGQELKINRDAVKLANSKFPDERLSGRNTLAATVSRYVKQAKAMIANTSLGRFPLL